MIFSLLSRKKSNDAVVARQYAALTAAARDPGFYTDMNVPDTVMGRFEMLTIQLVLYFRRTNGVGEAAEKIAQEIVEAFFEDIDHSIRELGVGDVGVPKRMKKLARMFYGRAQSFGEALNAGDLTALSAALARNIHPESGSGAPDMGDLARYMVRADTALTMTSQDDIVTGALVPLPALQSGS